MDIIVVDAKRYSVCVSASNGRWRSLACWNCFDAWVSSVLLKKDTLAPNGGDTPVKHTKSWRPAMCASSFRSASTIALRPLSPRERIAAVADPGSVQSVDASFDAPRPSPHLARWGIAAQDDDGIVVARATLDGVKVLLAAQDERFLGGSAGANHGDTLRRLFVRARAEHPAAVVLLAASAGVRLHEANAAELSLARALTALLDLRAAGVPVLVAGVADVFGGAAVLACAAQRTALLPGVRLGLSGPAVIETARGKSELDADDTEAVAATFGAEARAAAGHVELLAGTADAVRDWIAAGLREPVPFAAWVRAMQERLAARLVGGRNEGRAPGLERSVEMATMPLLPLPRKLASLYADAEPLDRACWLWRMRERPVWLSRPFGVGTFGPREAHGLDAALLAHLGTASPAGARTLFLVGDSYGHEVSRHAEELCVAQYLAQHSAVLALLRMQGVSLRGLLTGVGHSAAFFANALQAPEVYALADARVVAMEPAAVARVTRLPESELAALIENDPLLGQPVRHFARWGGIAKIVSDIDSDQLLALAARDIPPRPPSR
jgi:malonate decarboxylase beta subunit